MVVPAIVTPCTRSASMKVHAKGDPNLTWQRCTPIIGTLRYNHAECVKPTNNENEKPEKRCHVFIIIAVFRSRAKAFCFQIRGAEACCLRIPAQKPAALILILRPEARCIQIIPVNATASRSLHQGSASTSSCWSSSKMRMTTPRMTSSPTCAVTTGGSSAK